MSVFACGDRVVCVREYDGKASIVGASGTVFAVEKPPPYGYGRCGVCFDKNIFGHSLGGRCKQDHGWWIPDSCLEPEVCGYPDLGELF